jgi:DNA-binding CsgD family transcriptional regulator
MQRHDKASELDGLEAAIKAVLDRWLFAVIILSAERRLLFANKAARDMLTSGAGLRLHRRDGIHAAVPEDTAQLTRLLERATLAAGERGTQFRSVMQISRSSAQRPLIAFVTALHGEGMSEGRTPCAIFISDPELGADTDEGLLRSLYRLTVAEAKVAALLVRGYDAKGISKRLAVSFNTVRTHVKRVFEKTGTKRQSELVHLILCAPLSSRLKG